MLYDELNPFCLSICVEVDEPITYGPARKTAAELLANDVRKFLIDRGWAFGIARVEGVRAFNHPQTSVESQT